MSNNDTVIRLSYREKVPITSMKKILQEILQEKLTGVTYEGDKINVLAKDCADKMRTALKNLGYGDRYKFVVQVLIGEKKDQGVRMGTKCFWDAGTDNQATENFMNDSIFAVATSYAIYLY